MLNGAHNVPLPFKGQTRDTSIISTKERIKYAKYNQYVISYSLVSSMLYGQGGVPISNHGFIDSRGVFYIL
jgi:hypothetical protein